MTVRTCKNIFLAAMGAVWPTIGSAFVHPGLMYNQAQVDTFKTNALSREEPWASTYDNFLADPFASPDYTMKGPGAVIGNSEDSTVIQDSKNFFEDVLAVHLNGLRFVITEDTASADKAAEIVDAWSSTLTEVTEGSNFIGMLGGWDLVNGAELVYHLNDGWPTGEENFARAQRMVTDLFVPTMDAAARPPEQPASGGNQGFGGHRAGLAFAIFINNQTGFEQELGILKQEFTECTGTLGSGMPALLHNTTGQSAEAGRDQGHAALEVGWIEEAARVAANQGHADLFDYKSQDEQATPLLLLAFEYFFKYNLGNDDVPFDTTWHPCCCGNVDYEEISDQSRGLVKPLGEAAYNYYVAEKSLSMPSTKEWLQKNRPLEASGANGNDFLPYSTLTWATEEL